MNIEAMRRRVLLAAPVGNRIAIPKGVSIVTSEGAFVKPQNWNNQLTAVGVAVSEGDKTIILSLTTLSVKWSTKTGDVANVPTFTSTSSLAQYTDGVAYTQALASADVSSTATAAYKAQSSSITVGDKVLNGHIPSTGEWVMVANVAKDVEEAYTALGLTFVSSPTNYWSSCERAAGSVWICEWTIGGMIDWTALSKTNARVLRVFFSYKNS